MSARPRQDPTPGPTAALRAALRRLLRPLVRLLIRQGVTHPELSALLRELYVEVADRELALPDRAQTTTRVSLLTGIHRKEVKRLREEPLAAPEDAPSARAPLGAQIVARWTSESPWLDADGHPRPLPRLAGDGEEPSFEGLVASLSTDLRARTVLDEWARTGWIDLDDEDRVHLRTEAFVPQDDVEEKLFFFGRNLRDHIAAGAHNLDDGDPPLPDRAVYYDRLSRESVDALLPLAEKLGMDALRAMNRRARALQRRDEKRGGAEQRMTLGFYFFRDDATPAGEEDE